MNRLSRWREKAKADAEANEQILNDHPELKKMLDHFQMANWATLFILIIFIISGDDDIPDFIAIPVVMLLTASLIGKYILGNVINYFRENNLIKN